MYLLCVPLWKKHKPPVVPFCVGNGPPAQSLPRASASHRRTGRLASPRGSQARSEEARSRPHRAVITSITATPGRRRTARGGATEGGGRPGGGGATGTRVPAGGVAPSPLAERAVSGSACGNGDVTLHHPPITPPTIIIRIRIKIIIFFLWHEIISLA